jgi:hypothetical protein
MTEERINWILELIHKYPEGYGEITNSSADVWGGAIAWGYNITHNPKTDIYQWEDYSEVEGCRFDFVYFQLTKVEVIEKLQKLKNN